MAYRVSVNRFARIVAKMGPDMEAATIRGLQSAALRLEGMIPEAIQDSRPYPPIDNSVLMNSHYTTLTERGALVGVDAPHAPFMEYGTRPRTSNNWPPFGPLADWSYRKGIIALYVTQAQYEDYLARMRGGSKALVEADAEEQQWQHEVDSAIRLVMAIIKKIAMKGIEPRFFMRRAIGRLGRRKIIQKEVQHELEELGFGEIGRKVAGDLAEKAAQRRAKKGR